MQQETDALRPTAEDDLRPLRRPGNRTRSPSRQLPETTFTEKLQLLDARIRALETSQAVNVQDQKNLKSDVRQINVGMEDLRTEVVERTAEAMQRIDQHHVLTTRLDQKLDKVLEMLTKDGGGPSRFDISSPVPEPPGIGQPGVMETHTVAQAQRSPHFEPMIEREARPASPPMMSFVQAESQQGYRQREWQPAGASTTVPNAQAREQRQSMWGPGAPVMTTQNFRVCQKPNQRLFVFDGMMINYKLWASRMRDHLCNRSTRRYESLLHNIEMSQGEILKDSLLQSTVDGVNSWEVAEELEGFIFDFVNSDLYDRRQQFTNGEAGNGFEAWRQLFQEFAGGSAIANVGGFRRIQEFPRCEDIRKLGQHLADWEQLINQYGKNLQSCPVELRMMTLGIIPRAFEDGLLLKDVEYPTWRSIAVYCRARTKNLQHRAYADLIRHPKSPTVKHAVNSFSAQPPHPSDADIPMSASATPSSGAPGWANELINAVRDLRSFKAQPPPAPHGAARAKAKARPKAKAGGPKFMFKGCWQCGDEGHHRADCPDWMKILDSSGAPPKDHKGARDVAYARWKEKRNRARVNCFEEVDEEMSDEFDDEFDAMNYSLVTQGTSWGDAVCEEQHTTRYAHVNTFASLDEGVDEPSETAMVDQLNSWAHVVVKEKKGISQKERKMKIKRKISSPEDLQKTIKPLPESFTEIAKLARNHPSNKLLKAGEQWLLFDTGANVDAADIEVHYPEYANRVVPLDDPNAKGGAECASGNVVKCRGQVTVQGSIDGRPVSIPFRDMKIRMPIASLKNRVTGENGFDIFITEGGAVMRHRRSGKLASLYDRGGVYFAKFKPHLPSTKKDDGGSPFGRLG